MHVLNTLESVLIRTEEDDMRDHPTIPYANINLGILTGLLGTAMLWFALGWGYLCLKVDIMLEDKNPKKGYSPPPEACTVQAMFRV